jgi:hypothetical protein
MVRMQIVHDPTHLLWPWLDPEFEFAKRECVFFDICWTVLHGSGEWTQQPQPCWESGNPDIVRASQRQHAVQGTDSDAYLGHATRVRT